MREIDCGNTSLAKEVPALENIQGRQRLVACVRKLGELRESTEASVSAPGSLEAEAVLKKNIPALGFISNGDLKAVRHDNQIEARIASLPQEVVDQTQDQIDLLMGMSLAVGSLSSARRLEPYLLVTWPKTRAGLETLKLIAQQFAPVITIHDANRLSNIPGAAKVLDMLDKELKTAGLNDEDIISALNVRASEQAQARLERSKIEGSSQISQIKAAIAERKMSVLRHALSQEGGGRSEFESKARRIIETDGLAKRSEDIEERSNARLRQIEEVVLNDLVRKRAIKRVISMLESDPLLCGAIAKRQHMTPDELAQADEGTKTLAANNALNSKRIIVVSIEDRRAFSGRDLLADERKSLEKDPTDDELVAIRNGVPPKISERKAKRKSVFDMAKERLREQLEDEVKDNELIDGLKDEKTGRQVVDGLTKVILDEMISPKAPDAIDKAIAKLGIGRDSVLEDPNKLAQLKDEIVVRALEFLIVDLLEETVPVRATTLTDSERRRQREASLALLRTRELNSKALDTEARLLLDQNIEAPGNGSLGTIILRTDIKSTLGPFQIYPEYKTTYPQVVTQALENLYEEYNQAFRRLVAANKEFDTDYQYCLSPDGTPINSFVQIDMVGLPAGFLEQAATLSEEDVREALRGRIFEIENSIAMYSLLEYFFSDGTQDTLFKRQFRAGLDDIRQKYGRPIALLAVTDQKYQAMRETEFGKRDGEPLTDQEVMEYSGFDRFFSPEEFKKHIEENGGQSDYLLYVRSSDPVAKMKRPDLVIDKELLADDNLRRIIKANALTFNIDNPNLPIGDSRRINDTKEYLGAMGMAFTVFYGEDLTSPEFNFYLRSQGVDPAQVESGQRLLRAKPMKGTYGGYGHFRGTLGDVRFRRDLRDALLKRGAYVVQPELQNPTITNQDDGRTYMYIDRVFFSSDGQNYRFMGGERTLMPIDSIEAQNNRVHGNSSSVYAEII